MHPNTPEINYAVRTVNLLHRRFLTSFISYPSHGKDMSADKSSSTFGKVGDSVKGGMHSVGEYIGDKYDGNIIQNILS